MTDLGTEFGVEVSKEGNTTSHVFRGSVELRTIPANGNTQSIAHVLHENQSAGVDVSKDQRPSVHLATLSPELFVRRLPKWVSIKVFNTAPTLRRDSPTRTGNSSRRAMTRSSSRGRRW